MAVTYALATFTISGCGVARFGISIAGDAGANRALSANIIATVLDMAAS
jgi:hypothetical protein